MDRNEVRVLIHEFFSVHKERPAPGASTFSDNHDLFDNGDLDSFGFVELLSFLGTRTGRRIDLTDFDPAELTRVGAIVAYFSQENEVEK